MKKEEAQVLAPIKSKLLMEYIQQILSDSIELTAQIHINTARINQENMCTYDIYVSARNFERHINTGISAQQSHILRTQILSDLIEYFMESETIGITKWEGIKSSNHNMNFDGVMAFNTIGSQIQIDFKVNSNSIKNAVDAYNHQIQMYIDKNESKTR